jgi:NADH:ubiquinone oxidoreductase subunit K
MGRTMDKELFKRLFTSVIVAADNAVTTQLILQLMRDYDYITTDTFNELYVLLDSIQIQIFDRMEKKFK